MKNKKLLLIGTGTTYPLQVGAILRLAEEGYTFSEIGASGWPALIAAALGTGYSTNTELTKFIKKTLPSKHNLFQQSYWSLYTKWGTVKTKNLKAFLLDFFVNNIDELQIPTSFIATDVGEDRLHVFNKETSPGLKVVDALAATMAIPMFMEPAKINNKFYVDGAQASMPPTQLFINDPDVIVLKIESKSQKTTNITNIKTYIDASVNSWVKSHSTVHIPEKMMPNVIRLKTEHLPFDLSLTDSDVDFMVAEGYRAADKWIKER